MYFGFFKHYWWRMVLIRCQVQSPDHLFKRASIRGWKKLIVLVLWLPHFTPCRRVRKVSSLPMTTQIDAGSTPVWFPGWLLVIRGSQWEGREERGLHQCFSLHKNQRPGIGNNHVQAKVRVSLFFFREMLLFIFSFSPLYLHTINY